MAGSHRLPTGPLSQNADRPIRDGEASIARPKKSTAAIAAVLPFDREGNLGLAPLTDQSNSAKSENEHGCRFGDEAKVTTHFATAEG